MKIIKKADNSVIAEDVIIADTLFKRMKGLLGKKEFGKGQAIVLEPCNSIHTFFMRFPIDVLFLDKENKILKAVPSLEPFKLTRVYFSAARTVELSCGTIKSFSIKEGDSLLIA